MICVAAPSYARENGDFSNILFRFARRFVVGQKTTIDRTLAARAAFLAAK